MAIDPVCLMEVEEATAQWTSEYKGQTYYFCAPGCKVSFDEDPEKYLSGDDAGHGRAAGSHAAGDHAGHGHAAGDHAGHGHAAGGHAADDHAAEGHPSGDPS